MKLVLLLCGVVLAVQGQPQHPGDQQLLGGLVRAFDGTDTNNDGVMEVTELEAIVKRFDSDGNLCVTMTEFQTVAQLPVEVSTPLYAALDVTNHGCFNVHEANQLFQIVDTSGDGLVQKEEFVKYFADKLTPHQ